MTRQAADGILKAVERRAMEIVAPPEMLAAFDYSSIEGAKAKRAKVAAEYIKGRHNSVVATMLEIGSKLLEVKNDLEHGQFLHWIGAEFGWSVRSAQNYMTAAKAFGGKSATVAYLPVSTVYQLARIAEPIRGEVVKRIEAEQLPVEAIEKIVAFEQGNRDGPEYDPWNGRPYADAKTKPGKRALRAEEKALERFRLAFGIIMQGCEAGPELNLPHSLPADEAKEAAAKVRAARRHLSALLKRIEGLQARG